MTGEREMDYEAVATDMPQLRENAYRFPQRGRRPET